MMKLAMMKSFVARATLPRLFLPVQKLQQGSSKRACLCVYVCVCVAVAVCLSGYVCLCVCVSSLRPLLWLLFLTQRSGFSLLPIRVGACGLCALWAWQAGSALWHILILLCAAENANFSTAFCGVPPVGTLSISLPLSHFPLVSTHCLPPSSLCFVSVANL